MNNRNKPSSPYRKSIQYTGLTKLETAAIAAMKGILSGDRINPYLNGEPKEIAILADKFANALFDKLEKEQ